MQRRILLTLTVATVTTVMTMAAGCQTVEHVTKTVKDATEPPKAQTVTTPSWQAVAENIERLEVQFATTTQARLVLYRFPQQRFSWRIEQESVSSSSTTPGHRISDWAKSNMQATLIVNGAYFHEDGLPSGMVISKGKRVGKRKFDFEKTGFIIFGNEPRIVETAREPLDIASVNNGAQSYPLLINDGKVAVTNDSGKYARRTFIGLDAYNRVYIGVVPDEPLSLFEFATTLSALDVQWTRAINLDGGPSTGLSFHAPGHDEIIDSYTPVPNVIIVERIK